MNLRRAITLLGLLLAGCNSDPSATTAEGSVAGVALASPSAVYSNDGDKTRVILSGDAQACGHLVNAGATSNSLVGADGGGTVPSLFLLISNGGFFSNEVRTVGDDLSASFDPGGPFGVQNLDDGGCLQGDAQPTDGGPSGSLFGCRATVDASSGRGHLFHTDETAGARSDARATGDFDLQFPDGGALHGTFVAAPCNAIHGGCSYGAGGILGSLLALGLLLGRRQRAGNG